MKEYITAFKYCVASRSGKEAGTAARELGTGPGV